MCPDQEAPAVISSIVFLVGTVKIAVDATTTARLETLLIVKVASGKSDLLLRYGPSRLSNVTQSQELAPRRRILRV